MLMPSNIIGMISISRHPLGMDQVPSASRLRQRLDADADTLLPVMYEQSI